MKNYKVKAEYGNGEIIGDFIGIGIGRGSYPPTVFTLNADGVIVHDFADAVKLIEDNEE